MITEGNSQAFDGIGRSIKSKVQKKRTLFSVHMQTNQDEDLTVLDDKVADG